MSWYALKANNVPQRYALSRNMQELLQGLHDFHQGMIDDTELGRLVRLTPDKRAAIADTISNCATIMKDDPEEMKNCLVLIEMCTSVLEIAGRPPPADSFPFLRLPVEIRQKIIAFIIDDVFRSKGIVTSQKPTCRCPNLDRALLFQSELMKALPSVLGASMSAEFFQVFFRKKKFRFRCSCELYTQLTRNRHLLNNIKHIAVHWCGPDSVRAFRMMARCPKLERLTILISKSTTDYINKRATLMRRYFPLHYQKPRMSDILGLDEILEIRGVREIEVAKARSFGQGGSMTVEMDMAHLCDLLLDTLTGPRLSGGQTS